MSVQTVDEIKKFLFLQQKTESELQIINKSLELDTSGNKEELINRLIVASETETNTTLHPQAIPLCTRGPEGDLLPMAIETMKKWRKAIFEHNGNTQEFGLLNGKGQPYATTLKYIPCGIQVLNVIIKRGWFMAHTSQRNLISLLKSNPDNFQLNIIQKPDSSGNSWLMLHCAPKE